MASNQLLDSLHLRGFLSFGPGSEPVALRGLNVLIGPNGVGKSNFIEAIELLHAAPTDFAAAIRAGGMPSDWIWHGTPECSSARIDAVLTGVMQPKLHYGIKFTDSGGRLEITDEILEKEMDSVSHLLWKSVSNQREIIRQQSTFSELRDYKNHPETTETGDRFRNIQIDREWLLGRSSPVRAPHSANLPTDVLLPQGANLGLLLNNLALHPEWERFNEWMKRFLPSYIRLNTIVFGGGVQIFLHEEGQSAPTSALRLSDGTLRFMSLLAILLNPGSAPLICIEEPEVGLHPDAMSLIAELLIEASAKTQLIVTTQSDALVSELTEHAESVLVCENGREGTELHRLESEKLQFWLEEYRLGDIWRIGKIGGNP